MPDLFDSVFILFMTSAVPFYICVQVILKNTRTDIFACTLVIKMVKWGGAMVLKQWQIFLVYLTPFLTMEPIQMVHTPLATR
jgi:hypothetical protein